MAMILLSNLSFGYEGSYQPVFEDISIALDTDWRLGLTGRNGRGKTTLLRLLLGAQGAAYGLRGFTGSIQTKVRFGYFPAPVEHPEWLAIEVAQQICPDCQQWQLERELSLLEFPEDALWRPFEQLSGGEKTKLQLAALFLQENAFPLIDEPTNHLDTESRQLVADYLKRQKGFLLVSHDRDFLDGCVDHILSLDRDGVQLRKGGFYRLVSGLSDEGAIGKGAERAAQKGDWSAANGGASDSRLVRQGGKQQDWRRILRPRVYRAQRQPR